MAREQVTAAAKEGVLDALGRAASKLRTELGESLATVQKFNVTLPQATTSSLEALKAYSLGEKCFYYKDPASAPPYFERALELDPNFAMAYVQFGNTYLRLNEFGRARECFAKAFSLRDHTSELEKLNIAAEYYGYTTGELDKALQAMQDDIEYKHSSVYLGLAEVYLRLGQYDKSAEAARTLLARDPESSFGFVVLASDDLALQDFTSARQIIQQAQARGVNSYLLHNNLYMLSFLQADSAGMAEQQRWFAGQRIYENVGLALAADTEEYAGHVNKARELTKLAADSAARADNKENAAMYRANGALQEAAYGNSSEARQSAADALKLAPGNPSVAVQVALAFAMIGETARAGELAQEVNKRFSLDTQLQLLGLPAIEAQLQLGRRQPELALNTLRAGLPMEFANTTFSSTNTSCLYPTYIRGQAYLAAGQGTAAAGEFQKILDHNGIVGNCGTGALAHLGVGRANVLQSRTSQGADADAARARALAAYRDFLTLWKNADPDIPILKQAKAEYAKLQ
jgi:tetratricopeptide (TPR) repeat protein